MTITLLFYLPPDNHMELGTSVYVPKDGPLPARRGQFNPVDFEEVYRAFSVKLCVWFMKRAIIPWTTINQPLQGFRD